MTIQSEIRKAGPYLGNGINTLFAFPFKIFKAQDLLVVYTDPAGIERTLILGTDYTVALNPDQDSAAGGSITTSFAPPAGHLVTMTSDVPNLQEVLFTNNGGFYPALLTKTLDKLTILVQQLALDVSRAVKVTLSTEKTPDELLASIYESARNAKEAEVEAEAAAASVAWIRGQRAVITQTGLWQIPEGWGGLRARVSLIGGGGGGGAGAAGSDVGSGGGGGGGGAGVWTTVTITIPIGLGSFYAVIGQGGAGGQLGGFDGGNGANGASTTLFDKQEEPRTTLATASGGSLAQGAGGNSNSAAMYPGVGGGNGDGGGGSGVSAVPYRCPPGNGGVGGTSFYGAGGRSGGRAGSAGIPGIDGGSPLPNTGAGGGGGGGGLGQLPGSGATDGGIGGAGASGLIIIDLLG